MFIVLDDENTFLVVVAESSSLSATLNLVVGLPYSTSSTMTT